MEVHILTLFPDMFISPLQVSLLLRAQQRRFLQVHVHNIRDFTTDRHRITDDSPYGGGVGMLMKPEPIVAGLQMIKAQYGPAHIILLSPQGVLLNQERAKVLVQFERLVLICGRYGGVDARVSAYIDAELSIGDYVLMGGELPALVVLEVVGRLIPGVLGDSQSVEEDSLFKGLLQGPQYTRPPEFAGSRVPEILLSGDHAAIAQWRRRQALQTTLERRPDLLSQATLTPQDRTLLQALQQEKVG